MLEARTFNKKQSFLMEPLSLRRLDCIYTADAPECNTISLESVTAVRRWSEGVLERLPSESQKAGSVRVKEWRLTILHYVPTSSGANGNVPTGNTSLPFHPIVGGDSS